MTDVTTPKPRWWTLRSTVLAVGVLVLVTGCGGTGTSNARWPIVAVETLATAQPVSSATMISDKPTVVTVWAVWCKPCRDELPALQTLLAESPGSFDVVGVNNGDDPATAQAFLDELGVDFTMYRDPAGRLVSALEVVSLPATLLVLPDGKIVWSHLGAVSIDEVQRQLAPYVAQDSAGGGRPIDG